MQANADEREQELRRAILARPFLPFTLVMSDGRRYEIQERGRIAYAEDRIFIRQPNGWEYPRPRMQDLAAVQLQQRPAASK